MYKVIHFFTDLQDFNHAYNVGDEFPRKGLNVTENRLSELSGSRNKRHRPLIKLVEESTNTETESKEESKASQETKAKRILYTKTDVNKMNKAKLVSVAKSMGIPEADTMSGIKLKKAIIERIY